MFLGDYRVPSFVLLTCILYLDQIKVKFFKMPLRLLLPFSYVLLVGSRFWTPPGCLLDDGICVPKDKKPDVALIGLETFLPYSNQDSLILQDSFYKQGVHTRKAVATRGKDAGISGLLQMTLFYECPPNLSSQSL